MLFVKTNNQKQQSTLQENFSRQGNLFAVPYGKANDIKTIFQTILFQIYGETLTSSKINHDHFKQCSELVDKIMLFAEDNLNMKISLETLREILQIIKKQQKKILLYQQYIIELNKRLMGDFEEDQQIINQREFDTELQELFQYEIGNKNNKIQLLDTDLIGIQSRIENNNQQCQTQKKNKQNEHISNTSINCKYQVSPINEDASTMHTLKSQVPTSPKYTQHFYTNYKLEDFNNGKLNNSFHYSEGNEDNNQIEAVVNIQIRKTSPHYYPSAKKIEDEQKQRINSLRIPEVKTKISDESADYVDLSGRVHPVPSFLHQESLRQMINKQKYQEVRKSKILKQSIIKPWSDKPSTNDEKYSANLKQIKYQNKMRRNSKKSLVDKKDLIIQQKSVCDVKPTVSSSSKINYKMNKLFNIKQKNEEQFQPQAFKFKKSFQ